MQKAAILALVTAVLVVLIAALVTEQFFAAPNNMNDLNEINTGARTIDFTATELQTWLSIKDRVTVVNTDPAFTGNRTLQWISMRNSSSNDYYQKSMEWLCFWSGQGASGEWQAVASIYNFPNSTSEFVIEVSRFTWHSLDVLLDGTVVAAFPQVTNDTVSLGYTTFRVTL
jgi:hypothetical protein